MVYIKLDAINHDAINTFYSCEAALSSCRALCPFEHRSTNLTADIRFMSFT